MVLPVGVENPAEHREYTYDPIGNRKTKTEATTQTAYTANAVNQYPTSTGKSYSYDADGNLTDDGTFNYAYDAENRLKSIEVKTPVENSARVIFTHDYMGR